MYSKLVCKTIETLTHEFNNTLETDCDLKLYKIQLSKFHELVPGLIHFLSESELNRAERYHFSKDKNRFIICRALLKHLLAEHVSFEIDKITIETDRNKKPYLPSHPSVFFNVSHAGDSAIIAIGGTSVGVDVEFINREFDYKEILPHIFSQKEIEIIEQSYDKHLSFYYFWTRKEAIVKAIGKGIDEDIAEIPVQDGAHSLLSSLIENYKEINVFSFSLNEDHVGSFAITHDLYNFQKIIFSPTPTEKELKLLFHK